MRLTIQALDDHRFLIEVEQAYPNCPKYIQRRSLKTSEQAFGLQIATSIRGTALTDQQIELIENADSLFVGSVSPIENSANSSTGLLNQHGGDVSYRGGFPGFVEVFDGTCLRIPDYRGNSMFNTLGNIQTYPKAGLVFIDFEGRRLLQENKKLKKLNNQNTINMYYADCFQRVSRSVN